MKYIKSQTGSSLFSGSEECSSSPFSLFGWAGPTFLISCLFKWCIFFLLPCDKLGFSCVLRLPVDHRPRRFLAIMEIDLNIRTFHVTKLNIKNIF